MYCYTDLVISQANQGETTFWETIKHSSTHAADNNESTSAGYRVQFTTYIYLFLI